MANQATVTAPIGAGLTSSALVLREVTGIDYDFVGGTFAVRQGQKTTIYSLNGVTTITTSVSGTNFTVTIS